MNPLIEGLANRDLRQRLLVPPARLAEVQALVIGVGAVGRQVAWLLAALGVPRLTLCDHDVVAVENLAPQAYGPADLGTAKVTATQELCQHVNPQVEVKVMPERFKRSHAHDLPTDHSLIVFTCVDSIVTRKLLWESLRDRASLYLDGRMSAEVVRVLASDQPTINASYAATLFAADEAYAGACTAKATLYSAVIAAGLMVGQFSKWLRRLPVDCDVTFNLLAMELVLGTGSALEVAPSW